MPRILSRHDLLPQTKQNYYGYSYNGSSSRSRSTTSYSPTMSTVSSIDTKTNLKTIVRQYEGLSYRIDDRKSQQWDHSKNDIRDPTPSSDENTWGYFVDFTSPVVNSDTQGRKSSSSYPYKHSSSSL
jgi:hypothetical protein